MPARTADTDGLPRIAALDRASVERRVVSRTDAPSGHEGEGFPVRRAFAGVPTALLDPFIHMDQMGSVDYPPYEAKGTDWHPHRGFETVTYIVDGTFLHQDSHGGGGRITDGATQWMTAGRGILHIETPPEELVVSGGLFHGVQLWVNLPAAKKMTDPRYQSIEAADQVLVASPDGGALVRVIAGDLAGHRGSGSTHTPITFAHATVEPGAQLVIPWRRELNALVYALSGSGTAGSGERGEAASLTTGTLVALADGSHLVLRAGDREPLDVLLLGGEPIGEPVAAYGPFVMNTRAELQQAFDDFQAGRLGTVPPDGLRPYRRGREPRDR